MRVDKGTENAMDWAHDGTRMKPGAGIVYEPVEAEDPGADPD